MNTYLIAKDNHTILRIHLMPGAKSDEILGPYGEPVRLKLKIKAAPIDGEANLYLINYLAKKLKLRKNQIEILRGHQSRQKDLLIDAPMSEIIKYLRD